MRTIFIGPNGLRAGWRLLIFFAIVAAEVFIAGWIVRSAFPHAASIPRPNTLTPALTGSFELLSLSFTAIAAFVMSKIERRPFAAYGIPVRRGIGARFWGGAAGGFIAISGVMLVIFALHGFRVNGIATGGVALLQALVLWVITFLIVGLSEEFTFRGYVQYTLTTGIYFWPASIVTSCLFAVAHTGNFGESPIGIFEVALFAIVFCFVLLRTGNLWWGIGFHAAWDWGETFFYGVPDSGLRPWHPFLSSSSSGPVWLTGGSTGPEASLVTCVALLLVALYVARVYPRRSYPEVLQEAA